MTRWWTQATHKTLQNSSRPKVGLKPGAPKIAAIFAICDCDTHRGHQKLLAISETRQSNVASRLRVRWKVASDLRFRAAISEPEIRFFLQDFCRFGSVNTQIASIAQSEFHTRSKFATEAAKRYRESSEMLVFVGKRVRKTVQIVKDYDGSRILYKDSSAVAFSYGRVLWLVRWGLKAGSGSHWK